MTDVERLRLGALYDAQKALLDGVRRRLKRPVETRFARLADPLTYLLHLLRSKGQRDPRGVPRRPSRFCERSFTPIIDQLQAVASGRIGTFLTQEGVYDEFIEVRRDASGRVSTCSDGAGVVAERT
jgi:hypothetical protein